MCCAFNIRRNLKESLYKDLVTEMQVSSDPLGKSRARNIKYPPKPGIEQGLRLTIDLHSNFETFGTVGEDPSVFKVLVGQPADFPFMRERRILLKPGEEHDLSLSNQHFSANNIESVDPVDRNCLFSWEGNLKFHENYTFSNCLLECGIEHSKNLVGCVPWFLPNELELDSTTCDPWTERFFMAEFGAVDENVCQHCLPDCEAFKTSVQISSGKFRLKRIRRHPVTLVRVLYIFRKQRIFKFFRIEEIISAKISLGGQFVFNLIK